MKFSKPAGEQRYPIKITCAPAANAVRKVMEWTQEQSMNVPGAIFADEGVIIFALEQAYSPVSRGGGWAVKRQREEAAVNAAAGMETSKEVDS